MKLFQVDAFTDKPFAGNPAGVCLLSETRPATWLLGVAREMNLSETAFLVLRQDGYDLRWFTPETEVSLCGHATLASAHILWEEKLERADKTIRFHTKSGILLARRSGDLIEMDFPARPLEPTRDYDDLNESLQVSPIFTGKHTSDGDIYLLEVEEDETVRGIAPDYQKLAVTTALAVIVTSKSSDPRFDFISRFFAPTVGINEDPVTGLAHCYLTPYWGAKLGKKEMVAFQASRRSGVVQCTWTNDRVQLGGNAVTVFKAELLA